MARHSKVLIARPWSRWEDPGISTDEMVDFKYKIKTAHMWRIFTEDIIKKIIAINIVGLQLYLNIIFSNYYKMFRHYFTSLKI